LSIKEFAASLRGGVSKRKRPYQEHTITNYADAARALDRWMTASDMDGDFTACDTATLNRFFADYLKAHTHGGTNTLQRNLAHLFEWLHGGGRPVRRPDRPALCPRGPLEGCSGVRRRTDRPVHRGDGPRGRRLPARAALHRLAHLPALWLGTRGRGPTTGSGIYQMIKRRAEEAGYDPKEIWLHQWRDTFANDWLAGGGFEGGLMRLMGWTETLPAPGSQPRRHK
jgi:hypothetical protein